MRKYVFISGTANDIKTMFSGMENAENQKTIYMEPYMENFFLHLSKSWLSHGLVPELLWKKAEDVFFSKYIDAEAGLDYELCFILTGGIIRRYGKDIIDYLRRRYSDCKIVCYFMDLIKLYGEEILEYKSIVDAMATFDYMDSHKYGIAHIDVPFTYVLHDTEKIKYDACFIGRSKGRYKKIIELYEKLSGSGWRCFFSVSGVERNEHIYSNSIKYNTFIQFDEVIEKVAESWCVIELMQDGAYSPTARYKEAMLYGKYLISDCESLKGDDRENIIYFDSVDDLDLSKIILNKTFDNHRYIEEFSTDKFIMKINRVLSESV